MKNLIPSSSALLRGALSLVALFGCAATPAYSAGTQPSTSAYATIQPNLAGTGTVYTISYVAGDDGANGYTTPFATGFENTPFGNGGAALDDVTLLGGGDWFQTSVDGTQKVVYRTTVAATSGLHTQNVNTLPNTNILVNWQDPLITTIGLQGPTNATPQWNDMGTFLFHDVLVYGSGIQGVTGVFNPNNPTSAGATVGLGVGIQTDTDGGVLDDLGFMVVGYNDAAQTVRNNIIPRKGYVQVVVPYPTQVETATIGAGVLQVETLPLSGNANGTGTAQVETATIAGTIPGTKQVETLTLSGASVASRAQVETATIAGTITASGAGNALITVTGSLIVGSPLAVNVAVANSDTAATVAGKVRTALGLQTAITDFYTVGGSSATVTLTKKVPFTFDDTTLNIASANGTCAGLTPNGTSANTTTGQAATGTLNIVVTAPGMSGSPKTVPVTIAASDTTAQQTVKVVAALVADADVNAFFAPTGTTTVILTARNFAANEGTMNVASSPLSITGPGAVASSANTTAGVASGAGNALITVTGALITGSPLAVNVAVVEADTASLVAGKVRTALGAITDITEDYTVGGTAATVTLTKKSPFTANDGTLNIASANGTCNGLTAAANSVNTTAGVAAGAGTMTITVTAAGMTNSPKVVNVAIVNSDTTTSQATKAATALNADPDVSAFFVATSNTNNVILTAKEPAANDATMNVASAPGTATGPTAVATSTDTTAGYAIGAGDVAITVLGADILGSPLAVNVALLATDTSSEAATKIRAALNALPAITNFYTVGGTGAQVTLTKNTAPLNAWDSTLNIASADGTTTGIVANPTSAGADGFTDRFIPGVHTNNPAIELNVTTNAAYTPKIAVSGDFDSNLDVDATDLTVAATGYAGAGGTGKFYRHGNVDGDTDVDNADLGYVIGAFAATPGTPPAATGSATLTYNPANGNVKLDATTATGAKITSFQLQTSAATIVTANYTPVTGGNFNGTYKNVTTSVIGDTDTSLAGVTGSAIDLGNVFPTGMDLTQLTAYLTTRVYTGESGTRQQQLTLAVASVATLDHFAISAIASPQTVGTAITGITLTARDATNATFTGFTGTVTFGGTAGITGTSASFVNGALSGVSVTPTVAGSNLTFTVTDPVSGKTGSTTIATVQTRYAAWSGGALANVDTNSDGVLNGVAWVVGAANPSASATALQPTSDITTDPNFLTFTYRRTDKANTDSKTAIAVEYGSDLSGWTTAVHDGTNIIITPADDGAGVGIDLVQVKIKKTLAVGNSLFARLKVVITP
jgi:hypothetical protein